MTNSSSKGPEGGIGLIFQRRVRVRLHGVYGQIFASLTTWRRLPVKIMLRSTRSQLLAQGTRRDAKVVTVQVGGGCLRHQMGVVAENQESARSEVRPRVGFMARVGSRLRGRVLCDLLGSVGCAKAVLLWCARGLHE